MTARLPTFASAWLLAAALASCASAPPSASPEAAPAGTASARAPSGTADRDARAPLLLLISIDAFRADYLDRGLTPNLARIAREGVRARWLTPSYPSLTFPNHYSLVTGLRPDRHGIVHNMMRDPAIGEFKNSDPAAVGDSRWWGGEPIWVGAEKAGLRSATMFWPGSEAAIDGVRPTFWRRYDKAFSDFDRVDTVLGWLDAPADRRPRVVTLYFDKVDVAGHEYGPDSAQLNAALGDIDAAIGRLLDGLAARGVLARTDLIVVSDHGMATVAPGHYVALEDMVDARDATVQSGGQVINIAPNPGREAEAERTLLGAHPHYDCWRTADLPPRWHFGHHPRIAPIVCQMREGWDAMPRATIAERPKHSDRGSHGYDPALPSMRALFIARGPSFVRGRTIAPFDNVDVYPLLVRLLGIPEAPNDGDVGPLLPALRKARNE